MEPRAFEMDGRKNSNSDWSAYCQTNSVSPGRASAGSCAMSPVRARRIFG
jgi:hypothetical protein